MSTITQVFYSWKKAKPLHDCPHCKSDLRLPTGGIIMELETGGKGNNLVASVLDEAGMVVDVRKLVASGKLRRCACRTCIHVLDTTTDVSVSVKKGKSAQARSLVTPAQVEQVAQQLGKPVKDLTNHLEAAGVAVTQ